MEGVRHHTPVVLAAIPARFGSTRFAGKPVAPIAGRPMIAWVVDAALRASMVDEVLVVSDHEAIAHAARDAGARAVCVPREAASGTDRLVDGLAVDTRASEASIIVNLQGDEPLIEPETIDRCVERLSADAAADIVTPVRSMRAGEAADDPNLVKAAVTEAGRALYFSRSRVPYDGDVLVHVGLYAYRRAAFDRFVSAPVSALERIERLEQLRALELGLAVMCVEVETRSIGVDVPSDIQRVEALLEER